VDSALDKARLIPRNIALRRVIRKKQINKQRPVFAVKYDPRLPSISSIQAKHWRSMTSQDQYMVYIFPQPPLTAFKKQKNLRDLLIRAKVPEPPRSYPQRQMRGMSKSCMACTACPYIKHRSKVKIKEHLDWNINKNVSCNSFNVIYMLECDKDNCKQKYIGETGRIFKFRLDEHRGYINNKNESQATGAHFNLPGHSLANLKLIILEQVNINDQDYRKEREHFYIRKFNTYHNGINKQK
jgi:hypothetical protein